MIPSREAAQSLVTIRAAQSLVTMRAAFWRVCANSPPCADSARALLCPSYAIVLENRKAARACFGPLPPAARQRGSSQPTISSTKPLQPPSVSIR